MKAGAKFLALKHESRILGQSFNLVCGFSKMEQVRLLAHGELAWLFLEPDTGLDHCLRILLSCFTARTSGQELSLILIRDKSFFSKLDCENSSLTTAISSYFQTVFGTFYLCILVLLLLMPFLRCNFVEGMSNL